MTNKKKRWKLARELREYGIDFITSQQMARQFAKGSLYVFEALEAGGFHSEPNYVATCGRGCCWEQFGVIYVGKDKNGTDIVWHQHDINRFLQLVERPTNPLWIDTEEKK